MPEDKKAKTEETPTPTPTPEAPATVDVSLTVADLRNLRTIIDIASTRGAFRGAELKSVGEAFEKLDNFVKAVDAKAQAETSAASTPETASEQTPAEEEKK